MNARGTVEPLGRMHRSVKGDVFRCAAADRDLFGLEYAV